MYKKILLAYDGTESGQKALLDCRELAQWSQAQLNLIAVMPRHMDMIGLEGGMYDAGVMEHEKARYKAILEEGLRRLSEAGHSAAGEVLVGESVDEITRYAKKIGADLIVVGHKHLDGWAARWWRGATSRSLIEYAHCSVLVVITQ